MTETKICIKCGEEKPIDGYRKDKQIKSGYRNSCKACEATINKIYKDSHKEEMKIMNKKHKNMPGNKEKAKNYMRNYRLIKAYGITVEEYDDMYISQGGSCAICGRHQAEFKRRFCVDHCHDTEEIRGLLCSSCNTALGLMKDNTQILTNAIKYLENH